MPAVRKNIQYFLVPLPSGNYEQHFENTFQTVSVLVGLPLFFSNRICLIFLPNNGSWGVSYQSIGRYNSFYLWDAWDSLYSCTTVYWPVFKIGEHLDHL